MTVISSGKAGWEHHDTVVIFDGLTLTYALAASVENDTENRPKVVIGVAGERGLARFVLSNWQIEDGPLVSRNAPIRGIVTLFCNIETPESEDPRNAFVTFKTSGKLTDESFSYTIGDSCETARGDE